MTYRRFIRPLLFRMFRDAESAHDKAMSMLAAVSGSRTLLSLLETTSGARDKSHRKNVMGIEFPNPIGLAAGFDKDGVSLPALGALGFGFVEVGTVTWHAQPGNPKPRLFRYPEAEAIVNRMGFNNAGAAALAAKIRRWRERNLIRVPLGVSIGKSKVTPLEEAVGDYLQSFEMLYPLGDYFAVNVSSPNTPGLRELQEKHHLKDLILALAEKRREFVASGSKPILVKVAPDLSLPALDEALALCSDGGFDGIIATNTTVSRDNAPFAEHQQGGLSGGPLFAKSLELVQYIRKNRPQLPVIGVGGILCADQARQMLDAGADLIQVYTGFIYGGPFIVRQLLRGAVRSEP